MRYLVALAVAFGVSALLTWLLASRPPLRRLLLQDPTDDRWHGVTTPSSGGVAMFSAFAATLAAFGELGAAELKVLGAGTVMFAVGLVDDIRPLGPGVKLAGQLLASIVLVALGVHAGLDGGPLVYFPLSVAWVVLVTNGVNLIDGMDGLAAGVSALALISILARTVRFDGPASTVLIATLLGAVLGFLVFNVNPARIFMGDSGALWLGMTLAAITLLDRPGDGSNFLTVAMPVMLLAVPLFDTALVVVNRVRHRRPISQGGRDHSSNRLVALGLDDRGAVAILWGIGATCGVIAYLGGLLEPAPWTAVAAPAWAGLAVFGVLLSKVDVYGDRPLEPGA
ncbi:MAG: MraY family glycosyltransferase [Acidimicrobiia bacterium]